MGMSNASIIGADIGQMKGEPMSDLTRDDVREILESIFGEQRDMTDEERQAYYDMLRKKERRTDEHTD